MQQTTIDLGAGVQASALVAGPGATAAEVLPALALPPHQAVLLLLGAADGLDAALLPRLSQFFGRGIARAALDTGAVILDGGTDAGVMALMGQGVASRGHRTALVGVAPAALVAYPGRAASGPALEPHHSHFVLTEGDRWGAETPLLFGLLAALRGPEGGGIPALGLVVGGGDVTLREVLRAVRLRLPLLVLSGTGGVADVLAAAWPTREALPDDPILAEILAEGTLSFYDLGGTAPGLAQHIVRRLGADSGLVQAWATFAEYDHNANLQQRRFDRLQQGLIWLGLVGAGLAIVQQLYAPKVPGTAELRPAAALWAAGTHHWWVLHHALLLIPIVLTVLVAAASRFRAGTKWLLLRGGAEAIKRELYGYRTRTGQYQHTPETLLTRRVEEITRRTMRTVVNTSSLVPPPASAGLPPTTGGALPDDGLSWLPAGRYVQVRLDDQLRYYRRKAVRLEAQLRLISWLTFGVGGVGTYLAAVGQQVWIALTTAGVAALSAYLGYRQTESTLTKYNQSATDLANVRAWWHALSPDDQLLQTNSDLLVAHTEQVLQSNLDGWVQHMQNTLAELHKAPPAAAAAPEAAAPAVAPAFPAGSAAFPPPEPAAADEMAAAPDEMATALLAAEETADATAGAPDATAGAPPTLRGAPDSTAGAPPTLRGAPDSTAGAPPTLRGAPPELRGTPPTLRGAPPELRGTPPTLRGAPPELRGAPPIVRGAPQSWRGIADDPTSLPPDATEYTASEEDTTPSDLSAEAPMPDDGSELPDETLTTPAAPAYAGSARVLAARAPGPA